MILKQMDRLSNKGILLIRITSCLRTEPNLTSKYIISHMSLLFLINMFNSIALSLLQAQIECLCIAFFAFYYINANTICTNANRITIYIHCVGFVICDCLWSMYSRTNDGYFISNTSFLYSWIRENYIPTLGLGIFR